MINWSKYFDKIICILEVQNTKKKDLLEKELERVGILNSGIFEYHFKYNHNCDNALYSYLEDQAKNKNHTDFCTNVNHFQVIQLAQYWQYKRILIIEDNIRFLKDLNLIQQILQNKPQDSDLILYDKIISEQNNFIDINNYYSKFTSLNSTACYELSNKGINKLKDLLETNSETNFDQYLNNPSLYLQDLNCYCSKTNLAIQVNFNKEQYEYPISIIQSQEYNTFKDEVPIFKHKIDEQLIQQYNDEVLITKDIKINLKDPITPTTINIFMNTTINVIDKLYPLLFSLTKYSQSKFNVYIMLDKQEVQQYYILFKPFQNERMNIKLLDCKLLFKTLSYQKIRSPFTKIAWGKLLIPTLFPNLDRMLYLDYDTIIANKGIEHLYNIDFKDNYLAGVRDPIYNISSIKYRNMIDEFDIFKNITTLYIQTGVVMFNIKKIIEDNKAEELKHLLTFELNSDTVDILKKKIQFSNIFKKNKDKLTFKFFDQSYLNYFFANKILEVNLIFNNYDLNNDCSNTIIFKHQLKDQWNFENQQEFINKSIILHFPGPKPWEDTTVPRYFQTKYQKQLQEKYDILKHETLNYLKNYYD